MPLDLEWVASARANRSALEHRAATLIARRTVKKQWQAAWLLRAIECMDLTSLSGNDTPGTIFRLCAKARQPLQEDLAERLSQRLGQTISPRVGAVCVYHRFVEQAVAALDGTGIPVAAVATGFPHGLSPLPARLLEVRLSVEAGASEIDVVIDRSLAMTGQWEALYDEVRAFREACGEAHLKTILATGELGTLTNVGRASLVCMMAGADFIKTSTGKESVNAVLPVGLAMVRAIREYFERTGYRVGFKPAGGIRTAKQAVQWLILMHEELAENWKRPKLFRLGASTLLSDIERQLEHFVSGSYSAFNRHPMA